MGFDDPLWILWSSGTTGVPKGIVQGHGGILVELLKAAGLGTDVRADDRFFFMTSTSWMVWNFLVAGLLHGATIVLYDGSPVYPDVDAVWRVAQDTGATLVGVGAGYLVAGEKAQARPGTDLDLSRVRSIMQTGSTLPPSAWHWTYDAGEARRVAAVDLRWHRHVLGAGRRLPAAAGVRRPAAGSVARGGPAGVERRGEAGRRRGGRAGRHPADAVDAAVLLERPRRQALPRQLLRHLPRRVASRRLDHRPPTTTPSRSPGAPTRR